VEILFGLSNSELAAVWRRLVRATGYVYLSVAYYDAVGNGFDHSSFFITVRPRPASLKIFSRRYSFA
jgi:hypothetical protein